MSLPVAEQFQKYMVVIDFIRLGMLPTSACRKAETTWTSMRQAMREHPEFEKLFLDAMEECRDQLAEILLEIGTEDLSPGAPSLGIKDPKMAKVISDNIKWLLEKYWPEKFAQRLKVETDSSDKIIAEALRDAIHRIPLPAAPAFPQIVDITPVVVTPEDELRELLYGRPAVD